MFFYDGHEDIIKSKTNKMELISAICLRGLLLFTEDVELFLDKSIPRIFCKTHF